MPSSPFCASFPVGSLCKPSVFLCPGLGFLEEGVYEYRDTHLETKSGQSDSGVYFRRSGTTGKQLYSDTICTINLSGGYHNHGHDLPCGPAHSSLLL